MRDDFLIGALTAAIYIYETGSERFAGDICKGSTRDDETRLQKEAEWACCPQLAISKLKREELAALQAVMMKRHRREAKRLLKASRGA